MQPYHSPVADSPGDELQKLHNLTLAWVETGWRHDEVEPFNFKQRLKEFYDWSSVDTRFFDSFDVEHRINYSADDYTKHTLPHPANKENICNPTLALISNVFS